MLGHGYHPNSSLQLSQYPRKDGIIDDTRDVADNYAEAQVKSKAPDIFFLALEELSSHFTAEDFLRRLSHTSVGKLRPHWAEMLGRALRIVVPTEVSQVNNSRVPV